MTTDERKGGGVMTDMSILDDALQRTSPEVAQVIRKVLELEMRRINKKKRRILADVQLIVEEVVSLDQLDIDGEERVG